jgi:thiamine biosynthesis lipoprotein
MADGMRKSTLFNFCILLAAVAANCLVVPTSRAEWYSDEQKKMGTRVEVELWADDPVEAERLLREAMAEFDRIEALMSTYIPSSEMSRINDRAAVEPQKISAELFALLQRSLSVSNMTDGAFDITYDSVGYLYDFRARKRPDAEEINAHLDKVDYHLVQLDENAKTVRFAVAGVRINLGGIAKGYAVEKVIDLLANQGVEHALANAGGDTRLLGDRHGKPWIVGIRDPNKDDAVFTRLALDDEAISTSGDYERYYIEDGERYHHILEPSTGLPVRGIRSVTIIGPDATLTDGLSTSVFVMGPEKGLELIARLPGYEAVVITDDKLYYSEGLNPAD